VKSFDRAGRPYQSVSEFVEVAWTLTTIEMKTAPANTLFDRNKKA
jgi:hypothetical protein